VIALLLAWLATLVDRSPWKWLDNTRAAVVSFVLLS